MYYFSFSPGHQDSGVIKVIGRVLKDKAKAPIVKAQAAKLRGFT